MFKRFFSLKRKSSFRGNAFSCKVRYWLQKILKEALQRVWGNLFLRKYNFCTKRGPLRVTCGNFIHSFHSRQFLAEGLRMRGKRESSIMLYAMAKFTYLCLLVLTPPEKLLEVRYLKVYRHLPSQLLNDFQFYGKFVQKKNYFLRNLTFLNSFWIL